MVEKNNDYRIKHEMMYMHGFYARNGQTCTLVKETNRTLVAEMSPLGTLDASINEIGFTLKGAMEVSKAAHKDKYMCPIIVNPTQEIVVFPTRSHKRIDAIWINPIHISRTYQDKGKTIVLFHNGHQISIDSRLAFFNSKLTTAEQYLKAKVKAAQNALDSKNNKTLLCLFFAVKSLTVLLDLFDLPLF